MRAADTDELQERIEHALWGFTQVYDAEDGRGTEIGVHAPVHKVVAAVLPIIATEVQAAKAEAWDEAYRRGVDDARLADDLRVDVGLGPDLYAQPARQNPYRATETGDRGMTDYTPTDEQMQADWHAYITTPDEDNYYYDALSSEEADARWSRWLAAHDARVRRDAWEEGAQHGSRSPGYYPDENPYGYEEAP